MFYEKDLNIFFKEFAIDCHKGDNSFRVIFDDKSAELISFSNNINARELTCLIKTSDLFLYKIKKDDELKIEDETFIVYNVKRERDGVSKIELKYSEEDQYLEEEED